MSCPRTLPLLAQCFGTTRWDRSPPGPRNWGGSCLATLQELALKRQICGCWDERRRSRGIGDQLAQAVAERPGGLHERVDDDHIDVLLGHRRDRVVDRGNGRRLDCLRD